MIPVELIGIISKPFALMIRLFANITAGHIIVLSLICLIFIFKSLLVAPVSILFVIFWFYKSAMLAATAVISHLKLNASQKYDWLTDAKKLPNFKKVHHLIIVPTYLEPIHILERGLNSLVNQDFPKNQISVVMAFEQREGKLVRDKAKVLTQKYKSKFANFLVTFHPDIPAEVKGKSSNEAYAGKIAKRVLVDEKKYDINFMTVSSKDADGVFSKKYLSALTYEFLTSKSPYLTFWQPVILYYTNIWRVPAPIRVMNSLGSVWQMALNSRTDRLINFSMYSLSLKLLDEVGYWDVDVIPEDFRIFFKSFFAKDGKSSRFSCQFLPMQPNQLPILNLWPIFTNRKKGGLGAFLMMPTLLKNG